MLTRPQIYKTVTNKYTRWRPGKGQDAARKSFVWDRAY